MTTLLALIIFGWVIGVTFFGSEIARAVNAPEPVKHTKTIKPSRR